MRQLEIMLTITLQTPLCVGGAGATGLEADKMLQRDARGRPIIPASQLKGRLRHACEALARPLGIPVCYPPNPSNTCPHARLGLARVCLICELFGSPAYPSPLRFSDLVYEPVGDDYLVRPGIGVDRRRGTVQENLLFLTETVVAGAQFTRRDGEGQEAPAISGLVTREAGLFLLAGLHAIQSWGGAKSRGLGWATVHAEAKIGPDKLDLAKEKEVLAQWLRSYRS